MPTTPNMGFRYPSLSDAPNAPLHLGQLAADADAAWQIPKCFLVQQAAQTGWTTATNTAVTFGSGSEVVDNGTFHDEASNTSRIVIGKKLGWWQISGIYVPASNGATTYARALIAKNGVVIPGGWGGQVLASATGFVGVSSAVTLVQATNATDYIELLGQQFAGSGTIGTAISTTPVSSSLTAIWQGV